MALGTQQSFSSNDKIKMNRVLRTWIVLHHFNKMCYKLLTLYESLSSLRSFVNVILISQGKSLSCIQLFATTWTIQSMDFIRPKYWSVAFPFSRGYSQPRDQTHISLIAGRFFASWATREALLELGDPLFERRKENHQLYYGCTFLF